MELEAGLILLATLPSGDESDRGCHQAAVEAPDGTYDQHNKEKRRVDSDQCAPDGDPKQAHHNRFRHLTLPVRDDIRHSM